MHGNGFAVSGRQPPRLLSTREAKSKVLQFPKANVVQLNDQPLLFLMANAPDNSNISPCPFGFF